MEEAQMDREQLTQLAQRLAAELAEAEAALPAHTVRPTQLQRVLEAEERLAEVESRIKDLEDD